ncbi:SRSF protein kinase 2-like isoform X1 [Diabrotica virgifera virgifera]|uniref:non-specific serine/threonine protein kinase n=2 Tax=Diabrotica virgifera virgifera TaxID=50390 RepID=A0A6P7G0W6_DIAVI|nr:SRSF protein kinase 2-like isoform X1 [Diabrotica virgifera virgifera]
MTHSDANLDVQVCYPNESQIKYNEIDVFVSKYDINVEMVKFFSFLNVAIPLVVLWYFINYKGKAQKKKIHRVEIEPLQIKEESLPKQVLWKPSGRCQSLYTMKLSPSKDTSLLDLDDIQKIRYIENRESQEDEKDYNTGGYMPINIGDILKGQYKVCRKLGWGHFSTVWLCQNLLNDGPTYVALKICKSAQMFTVVAQDEIKLLRDTKLIDPSHLGYKHIVQMVDTFKLLSINGVHTAISMEIMGPSLLHLLVQSDFRGIHLCGVKRIITQVLKGLTYLHEACRIIHTDIKPENILIKVDENYIKSIIGKTEKFTELGIDMPRSYVAADCWIDRERSLRDSDENILSKFEEQRGQSYPYDKFLGELPDFRRRHGEPRLNAPMWVSPNIEIKIADLGNACWEEHHFSSEIQTRQYRALEVILGAGYSFPADIWSVGCMGFEMATGEMLFSPKGDREPSANLDHLCLIWETLGSIPQYITENGTHARQYFTNGQLLGIDKKLLRIWKIEDVLVEKYKWKRVDAIPFAGFLESLIEPDPALRYTASMALHSEWITMND